VTPAATQGQAVAPPSTRLTPEPAQLAAAPPALLARLRDDIFNYFRFLNRPWTQRVCEVFAADLQQAPAAQLHGDAHLEQYAFTSTARGLDDFDDSARGPLVIDLVRFLGSIELAAAARDWRGSTGTLSDRFLEGYRKGLADQHYLPPEPAVVQRLRPERARSVADFLAFAESAMLPFNRQDRVAIDASIRRFDRLLRSVNPNLPSRYLRVKKQGWVRVGVGSALTPKVLLRVEGPSRSPEDDVIIEGKQLSNLRGVSCLELPKTAEAFRVISGTEQIGRIEHEVLAVVPRLSATGQVGPEWWVRSWDPSYSELRVQDYASVEELADVVYDAGAQLGAGAVVDASPSVEAQKRQLAKDALVQLEPKVRAVAHRLTQELLEEWARFKEGAAPAARPSGPARPAPRVP
jgi:uncharacterized protein (DUF2252 family)